MWCVWFLTHLPSIHPSPAVSAAVLFLTMLLVFGVSGFRFGTRLGLIGRFGAGAITALIDLLVLGSYLSSPPEQGNTAAALAPSAALVVPGFLVFGAIMSAAGLTAGSAIAKAGRRPRLTPTSDRSIWLARFGLVAAVAIVPLLLLGGLVTSTGSGLAVPDWPRTYSANMFLYPINLMTRRSPVFYEHSHRLFGSLIGLTTLTLMIFTIAVERRPRMRWCAAGLFVLVCLQGYLGGRRVFQQDTSLALVHGIIAQAFFALTVAFAAALSPLFRSPRPTVVGARERRLGRLSLTLLIAIVVQLTLGAAYRHFREAHAIFTHMGLSVLILGMATSNGFGLIRSGRNEVAGGRALLGTALSRIGTGLIACVMLQFALGWVAFWFVQAAPRHVVAGAVETTPGGSVSLLGALAPTFHQANGAVLLALATLAVVWSRWMTHPVGSTGARPVQPRFRRSPLAPEAPPFDNQ